MQAWNWFSACNSVENRFLTTCGQIMLARERYGMHIEPCSQTRPGTR